MCCIPTSKVKSDAYRFAYFYKNRHTANTYNYTDYEADLGLVGPPMASIRERYSSTERYDGPKVH